MRKIVIILIPLFMFWHWYQPIARINSQGLKAFKEKKYQEALKCFMEAKGLKDLAELKNNTASSLYKLKQYQKALDEFSRIEEKSAISRADFHYNLGNTYFKLNKYQEALKNYKKSLKLNSSDMDTKKNFEITLNKIKNQKKQKKEDEEKKDDKKNKPQKQEQPKPKSQKQSIDQKYKNLMKYLNQKEKKQLKDKKRKAKVRAAVGRKKDW